MLEEDPPVISCQGIVVSLIQQIKLRQVARIQCEEEIVKMF